MKNVEVLLYAGLTFYPGTVPFIKTRGKRHPSLDLLFITEPQYLKHELFALASRDIGIPYESHCDVQSCFCSSYQEQATKTQLCDEHKRFFREELSGKFEYIIHPILLCKTDEVGTLEQMLKKYAMEFAEQTNLPTQLAQTRINNPPQTPFWLVVTDQDYSHVLRQEDMTLGNEIEQICKANSGKAIDQIFLVTKE